MAFDAETLLDGQVTLYNRITPKELQDDEETQDRWYVTNLSPVNWAETWERAVDSTGTVRYSRALRLQIPSTTGAYLVPEDWLSAAREDELDGQYTVRPGDFVVFGVWVDSSKRYVRAEKMSERKNGGYITGTVSQVRDLRNSADPWRDEGFTVPGVIGKYVSVVFALCT